VHFQHFERICRNVFWVPALVALFVSPLSWSTEIPEELKGVGITEHLGDSVLGSDLSFRDETGAQVALSSYFNRGKPVVLVLAYYECPNLCTFVLNGLTDTLKGLEWLPGKQFEVVTLSINPRETPELARAKKAAYLSNLGKADAAAGWHFLTGDQAQIRKLSDMVGFGYKWMEQDKQYAHSAAIYALTPDGRISRYLYGIEYKPKDLKLALLEASNGKIGTVIDRLLLFCYRFDPKTHKYSLYATQLMRVGGAGTVVVFGGYLAVFWRRQRRRSKKEPA
jgi:protein SCO1